MTQAQTSRGFKAGDFLVFQLESAFGILRLLAVEVDPKGTIWHVAVYDNFYPEVEIAIVAAEENDAGLRKSHPHLALTNRAFESTQVAKIANSDLKQEDLEPLIEWRSSPESEVSDRSVRLLMGIR